MTESRKKITLPYLFKKVADCEPITWLTCYDYPTAYLQEQAGIEMILVGDSLGMTMLGAILIAQTNQDSHEGRGDMARAGAALTPLGAVLTLVSAPILIVRASRSARLRETEQTMQGLSGPLSLSPVWSRGQLGLIGRLRF